MREKYLTLIFLVLLVSPLMFFGIFYLWCEFDRYSDVVDGVKEVRMPIPQLSKSIFLTVLIAIAGIVVIIVKWRKAFLKEKGGKN